MTGCFTFVRNDRRNGPHLIRSRVKEKSEKKRNGRLKSGLGRGLNLILWFVFSLFAIVIVLLFMVVLNVLIDRQYRKQTVDNLGAAAAAVEAKLAENDYNINSAGKAVFTLFNSYGVSGYLIDVDGQNLLSEFTEQKSFPTLAEILREQFEDADGPIVISSGDSVARASQLTIDGQSCYLYVTGSLAPVQEFESSMGIISLSTALAAGVLAFVASGFVAMLVTKPVFEVTEPAKALAWGDYSLNLKANSFCREINELSDALEYARQEISRTDRMQKELIANVSHDFKTPLTMIKAYASMILEISGDDKEKREAHAKVIIDESDRLAALVADVLDLSKIQAGFGAGDRTVFNLSEEVYRVANRFDYLRETNGYRIETEVEEGLYTLANRDRIDEVLYNLIGNAINYTGEDKRVTVRLFRRGENSRFEVVDTGQGISEEEIPTIWDRYYRSSETHKRPVKGTGLGLSIVKGILTAHGYPFGVESQEGKGSRFWAEFLPPPEEKEQGSGLNGKS